MAIIAILAAILFPVFGRARENARRSSCQSNLKQLGLAFMQYRQDYDERLPNSQDGGPDAIAAPSVSWNYFTRSTGPINKYDMSQGSLYAYTKSTQIFVCPSDSIGQRSGNSYVGNGCVFGPSLPVIAGYTALFKTGKALTAFDETTKWTLLGEEALEDGSSSTDDAYIWIGGAFNSYSKRHFDGSNLLFMDGHVKWFLQKKIINDGYAIGGTGPAVPGTATCP